MKETCSTAQSVAAESKAVNGRSETMKDIWLKAMTDVCGWTKALQDREEVV